MIIIKIIIILVLLQFLLGAFLSGGGNYDDGADGPLDDEGGYDL